MPLAWTPEWLEAQMKSCREDKTFQEEADGNNRSYTVHVLADPDNGVEDDYWWGFSVPAMDRAFTGKENAWETDYFMEGTYADWHAINEGKKGLVASLLDQSISLYRGSTSYLAMFVPAVERFFELSRQNTDSYAGNFKKE
ncbi:MAG: hypothetical protein AB1679_31650 [Actinomycetota bacterium]|jgi:hypothetical protein